MGGNSGAQGRCPGAVEAEEVGRKTGLFPGGAQGSGGAPGDHSPCHVNC